MGTQLIGTVQLCTNVLSRVSGGAELVFLTGSIGPKRLRAAGEPARLGEAFEAFEGQQPSAGFPPRLF